MRYHMKDDELQKLCDRYDAQRKDSNMPGWIHDMYDDGDTYGEIMKTRRKLSRVKLLVYTLAGAVVITVLMILW